MRVMSKPFGSRTLLIICGALMILLAALAAVQYRWSTRVAAADAQREKEHLDSAAELFASDFNSIAGQAMQFLADDARGALESGTRVTAVPKLITEVYYLEFPASGSPQAQRLDAGGKFVLASPPSWLPAAHCNAVLSGDPAVIVAPVFEFPNEQSLTDGRVRVFRSFGQGPNRCFAARLDMDYLRGTMFPQLIRQSFGATAAEDYDFAVVPVSRPQQPLYGSVVRADLKKPFFSVRPIQFAFPRTPAHELLPPGRTMVYMQHVEDRVVVRGGTAASGEVLGRGAWELNVAHKGVPLATTFERTRRRDLLFSVGVEALLAAAVLFLVIATRRAQQLADQKMRFVAGVSHELRSPVSAISMLSRNQADGLVAGTERVKQYGELINQQSRRLNEMVEQALVYAGIHSGLGRPVKNEIDLRALLEEAVEARCEELAHVGFKVEMAIAPDLPRVSGDAALLRIAFDNLLSNAQKHACGGRWIRVGAAYQRGDREVQISVEDHGGGIEPADQAEIFEPFTRGRAAVESQIPGSGLGLSLVRSAAEAHRGSITLVSQPGRGSTFTLHLPV